MKVFILAAGLGTRLGNITKKLPKPMVDINGKPFLCYVIDILKKYNFTHIVLCVGYKSEVIIDYFGNGEKFGVNIEYSIAQRPNGTAGEIKFAQNLIDGNFMVINGDTLIDYDYNKLVNFHNSIKVIEVNNFPKISILCTPSNNQKRSGGVLIEDNLITSFNEKVELSYINAGIYVCDKNTINVLNQIDKDELSFELDLFPLFCQNKSLYASVANISFVDIGIPESLEFFRKIKKND